MLSQTRHLWRLALMAPLLLILLLSASQPQPVFAFDAKLHTRVERPGGFILIKIWQQALGFDGYNWTQIYTEEVPVYIPISGNGFGYHMHTYSYSSVLTGRTDDIWYGECGWVVNWDFQVFVSPPPTCTATIIATETWLPGFCWGCVAVLGCWVELADPEPPLEIQFDFNIGEEILLGAGWDHPNYEGDTLILLEDAFVFGGDCQHQAFKP